MERGRERNFDQPAKSKKLFVSNITSKTTQDQLGQAFSTFGDVVDVYIKVRPDDSAFAFVEMATESEAEAALKGLNRTEVASCYIKVSYAKPKANGGGDQSRGSSVSSDRGNDFGGNRGGAKGPPGAAGKRGCFNCGEEGHFSRECTQASNGRGAQGGGQGTGQGGARRGCFNCGEEGHFSRECTQANKGRGGGYQGEKTGGYSGGNRSNTYGNKGGSESSQAQTETRKTMPKPVESFDY